MIRCFAWREQRALQKLHATAKILPCKSAFRTMFRSTTEIDLKGSIELTSSKNSASRSLSPKVHLIRRQSVQIWGLPRCFMRLFIFLFSLFWRPFVSFTGFYTEVEPR